jgi:hypothetical protein
MFLDKLKSLKSTLMFVLLFTRSFTSLFFACSRVKSPGAKGSITLGPSVDGARSPDQPTVKNLIVLFDNSYSYLRGKTIRYNITVRPLGVSSPSPVPSPVPVPSPSPPLLQQQPVRVNLPSEKSD